MSYPLFSKLLDTPGREPPSDGELGEKLKCLRTALNGNATGSKPLEKPQAERQFSGRIESPLDRSDFVDVFVAFDEAHTLSDAVNKGTNESNYTVLRRALHFLSGYPFYTFFLSTTGKITQFAQPRGQDPSNRISIGLFSTPLPYIYLGFDQLMQSRKVFERWKTLDDVTSLECAAHMGRPL